MNIKKLIAGSMLSMLMASEMAAADWGDVYYCQMTNSDEITLEGERTFYKLGKFQFKLDQTKNAMVFGSTGFFADQVIELVIGLDRPSQEMWYADDLFSMTHFDKGKLLYSGTVFSGTVLGATAMSADCEKF